MPPALSIRFTTRDIAAQQNFPVGGVRKTLCAYGEYMGNTRNKRLGDLAQISGDDDASCRYRYPGNSSQEIGCVLLALFRGSLTTPQNKDRAKVFDWRPAEVNACAS